MVCDEPRKMTAGELTEEAAKLCQDRGLPEDYDLLVRRYGGVIRVMARRYAKASRTCSSMDLEQAAWTQVFARAIPRWDRDRGRFTTFAGPWAKNGMLEEIGEIAFALRMPRHAIWPKRREDGEPELSESLRFAVGMAMKPVRSCDDAGADLWDDEVGEREDVLDVADLLARLGEVRPDLEEVVREAFGIGVARVGINAIGLRRGLSRGWGENRVRMALKIMREAHEGLPVAKYAAYGPQASTLSKIKETLGS